ncbi:MAG: DUF1616 domain-containing protein [Candidatus Hodarchaeota archaeon]
MRIKENGKYDKSTIEELILRTIKESELRTVRELVVYLKKKYGISEGIVLNIVTSMKERDKLALHKKEIRAKEEPASDPSSDHGLINYLQSPQATDVWVVLTLTGAAIVATLLIPEGLYPVIILRWMLGALFVLFLPGYALTAALFPKKELDFSEQVAISFGLSLVVTTLLSLVLNFTPWGIALSPILICLTLITGISVIVGSYRKASIK